MQSAGTCKVCCFVCVYCLSKDLSLFRSFVGAANKYVLVTGKLLLDRKLLSGTMAESSACTLHAKPDVEKTVQASNEPRSNGQTMSGASGAPCVFSAGVPGLSNRALSFPGLSSLLAP